MANIKTSGYCGIAVASGIVCSGIISYPLSGEFVRESFVQDIVRSLAYLSTSAIAVACCRTIRMATSWWLALFVGVTMIITASMTYSLVRQYAVLLTMPSLFCLPGVALGKLIAEVLQCAQIARGSASYHETDG